MKCDYCGKEESLPFVCNYCNGTFCSDHRLPEAHQCPGDLSRRPVFQTSTSTFAWNESGAPAGRTSEPRSFSRTEVRDIIIAWLALGIAFTAAITGGFLEGFSLRLGVSFNGGPLTTFPLYVILVLALATIGVGFILHELMHKFISERYGFKAEFRMWPQGLAFALITSALAGIVFAAPGATYIMGYGINKRENGIISLAGPLTNIAIALCFLPLLIVGISTSNALLFEAGDLGSYFNFFLATFNMIPIFVLDGAKVWHWNKVYWVAVFIPLVIVIISYFEFGLAP